MPALLVTDIEGSTRLWEAHPVDMSRALARHDVIVAEVVEASGGNLLKDRSEGDSAFAVFDEVDAAIACGYALHQALAREEWPGAVAAIRVRMAIHSDPEGRATAGEGGGGPRVARPSAAASNRAAQLRGAGHGGQVLLSEAAVKAVNTLPPGARLRDLGRHGLADLSLPERVFSLQAPGLPDEFPPLRSLDPIVHNLPARATRFIGRHADVAVVGGLLSDGRLVSITGGGGWGKTRLALEVASTLVDVYPDGVWLADVAGAPRAALSETVASALGFAPSGPEAAGEIFALLAERTSLLVLDGCEAALPAVRALVGDLLAAASGVRVLTTTRRALDLPGEAVHRPGPLGLVDPGEVDTVDDLTRGEATTLFLDRAEAANPYYVPVDAQAAPIAEIAFRLRGNPLAVELAASRIRVLTPAQVLSRLDEPLRILAGGNRTAPARLQSIRESVAWSLGLLAAGPLAALGRLAVPDEDGSSQALANTMEDDLAELEAWGLLEPSAEGGRRGQLDLWVRAAVRERMVAPGPPGGRMSG